MVIVKTAVNNRGTVTYLTLFSATEKYDTPSVSLNNKAKKSKK